MSNREILLKAVKRKKADKKAAAWVKKAGGMDVITEDMAARIVKLCRLNDGANGGK